MGSKTIHILLWIVETETVEKRLTDVSRKGLWTTLCGVPFALWKNRY